MAQDVRRGGERSADLGVDQQPGLGEKARKFWSWVGPGAHVPQTDLLLSE